jgi:hypothetical protein
VDAARGVGSVAVKGFLNYCRTNLLSGITSSSSESHSEPEPLQLELVIDCRNNSGDGPVNEGCGAEIVQKGQVPPIGVNPLRDSDKLICSFDGDADRIVFHGFIRDAQG